MPQGDPGGHFAGSGGYGGNFGGFGGASMGSSPGGPEHGGLGYGGMSPGGYNSTTYGKNAAGYGGTGSGTPGFGARVSELAAQRRARAGHHAAWLAGQAARAAATGVTDPTTRAPVNPVPGQPVPQPPINPATGQPYADFQAPRAPGVYSGYGSWPNIAPEFQGPHPWSTPDQGGAIQESNWPQADPPSHYGGGPRVSDIGAYPGPGHGTARQFGGPVEPGQQYTVGENGPETLQMGPGGGGQVIPHNPMDRLGGMNPQMMQQLLQMQRQFGGGDRGPGGGFQGTSGQPPASPQPMPRPPMGGGGSYGQPQQPGPIMIDGHPTDLGGPPGTGGGPPRPPPVPMGGGWQNRMGIEGLSRPRGGGGGGFGLSGLGQPGVMGQLRRQGGFGGQGGFGVR